MRRFEHFTVKNGGRLATAGIVLAERPWGSIRRDGLPARLGAYWEGGWQAFVRLLSSLPRFYCHVGIVRGALVRRARLVRVAVHDERWNPEVAIMFGTAARYRRATVGRSYDDEHPDNSTLHMGAVCPHLGFVESLFFISSRTGHEHPQMLKMLPAFSSISWACAFAGDGASIFFSGLVGAGGGIRVLPRRAGSFGISWCTLSLVKTTLHRHRAGFEPQRASSYGKRVKAPHLLGYYAVRA